MEEEENSAEKLENNLSCEKFIEVQPETQTKEHSTLEERMNRDLIDTIG